MKVTFIGVGSAFDENHTNISMVLNVKGKNILLDCGYSVPHALLKHNPDKDYIDAIWISHTHADHYFGLGYWIRLKSEKRTKPLYILTRPEVRDKIETVLEHAYPGSRANSSFPIEFIEFEKEMEWHGIKLSIAPTNHTVPNKALRVEAEGKAFCYSGDGKHTDEGKELYRESDLLVHETFTLDKDHEDHGSIKSVAGIMKECNIKKLACVHLERTVRQKDVHAYIESLDGNIILPSEGDVLEV